MSSPDVVVVGAGIVGLAHALAAARLGLSVHVVDRSPRAVGASIRNFGMVWPIGQPIGPLRARALRSRQIWLEAAAGAGFSCQPCGSIHVAYHDDELAVLTEFAQSAGPQQATMLTAAAVQERSPGVVGEGLRGGLLSPSEAAVDPREAIAAIPAWLNKIFGVRFIWETAVTHAESGSVRLSTGETLRPRHTFVCSGDDFATLFPDVYVQADITRCKLQMMRTAPQPNGWRLGPHLAAGLTLAHYRSFEGCATLAALRARFDREHARHRRLGIHVMVSQHQSGELTIGDSHEYGRHIAPFDRAEIDELILEYLARFFRAPTPAIVERWHGIYAKLLNGHTAFVTSPCERTWAVTGLGGAGMTLSFGLAEEVVAMALSGAPFPVL